MDGQDVNAAREIAALPPEAAGWVDHLGIAVADLETGIRLWRDVLGLELERAEEVPTEQVKVAFLRLDRATGRGHVELLQPTAPESAIAKFVAKRGPGLHHVAIAVADVAAALRSCAEAGIEAIDTAPRVGAGGKQVAFLHPKSTGGVLIELCAAAPPQGRQPIPA